MTLAEMRRRMSSSEFGLWLAYDRIQPIGERRADLRTAYLAALVESAASGHQVQVSKHDHFAENRIATRASGGKGREPRSMEAQKQTAIRITRLLGGKVTFVKGPKSESGPRD